MKKTYGIIAVSLIAWVLFFTYNAKANDYNKTVVGHVIQNSSIIDKEELMKQEITRLAHKHSIELIGILQAYLPSILDGIAADLRAKSDVAYKCSLQPDNYKNKECND